jgi:CHAT domain-containing protein
VVSATVYAELKKLRYRPVDATIELLAFGDPLFPNQAKHPAVTVGAEVRSAFERGLTLGRLPFSRDEIAGIAALNPQHSQIFLGANATEDRAKALIPNARKIHFAIHAILDENHPLNSALVLTVPEKWTEGQENGLLQAWEIFEQVRLKADLVVLSACETGLGREERGEGLIGLTRAFQYAGARSVLASMWRVDDRRTAELMTQFYAQLQSGKSKDEALRAAQLAILRRNPADPYYWAAFSLIGDWQ